MRVKIYGFAQRISAAQNRPVKRNYKFKFLVTPMGKISLWDADLAEVSRKAEMSVDGTVDLFNELVNSY